MTAIFFSFLLFCGYTFSAIKFSEASIIQDSGTIWKFDFGPGPAAKGFQKVTDTTFYNSSRGFGIVSHERMTGVLRKGKNDLKNDYLTSTRPFYFSVNVPEGRYRVRLMFGDPEGESMNTVKAESRRLMLEKITTRKGDLTEKTIMVDVRTPKISENESIKLKSRELNYLNWDNKLTLEFAGDKPCISAVEISRVTNVPVIFLAGNSTVTDQENEPWASWGQMITRFLKPEIVVANYAESGEALLSFKGERRLQKILSLMNSGDYLFIEFAHNDQKPGGAHVDAFTTYKTELKFFIHEAQKKGGKPVLVTSMHRRKFDETGKIVNTLEDYPEAMRQTAREEYVPLIDLNAMSKLFYEALGTEQSKKAFVHYLAGTYPGQDKPLADDTHFNPYGAYELAKCVADGIRRGIPELARFLVEDFKNFDPARPDPADAFYWPPSPGSDLVKPAGN